MYFQIKYLVPRVAEPYYYPAQFVQRGLEQSSHNPETEQLSLSVQNSDGLLKEAVNKQM